MPPVPAPAARCLSPRPPSGQMGMRAARKAPASMACRAAGGDWRTILRAARSPMPAANPGASRPWSVAASARRADGDARRAEGARIDDLARCQSAVFRSPMPAAHSQRPPRVARRRDRPAGGWGCAARGRRCIRGLRGGGRRRACHLPRRPAKEAEGLMGFNRASAAISEAPC
jgi:hypothetical protein